MSLPTPIKELLDPPEIDDRAVQRARSRLFGSLARPARRRVRPWLAAAAAIAVASAAAVALWPGDAPPAVGTAPLGLAAPGRLPSVLRATSEARTILFDDGSLIELAPGAELRVHRNEPARVDLILTRGVVLFEIEPGGPRQWRVDMGRWDVEVIGTRFTLARSHERLRVDVERGLVRVESDEEPPRLLGAGAFAVLSLTPMLPTEPAEVDPVVESPSPLTSPPTRAPRHAPWRAPWRARAEAGDPHGAYALLRTRFPAEVRAARDVDALFALADVARLSGHPEAALQPLRRIVDELPRNPRAAVAAFTLGLLHGDSLGEPAEAARAFEQARALGLPVDLRESAAARRLAMWTRANRAEEARAAACDYLAEHPAGPAHADAQATCAP